MAGLLKDFAPSSAKRQGVVKVSKEAKIDIYIYSGVLIFMKKMRKQNNQTTRERAILAIPFSRYTCSLHRCSSFCFPLSFTFPFPFSPFSNSFLSFYISFQNYNVEEARQLEIIKVALDKVDAKQTEISQKAARIDAEFLGLQQEVDGPFGGTGSVAAPLAVAPPAAAPPAAVLPAAAPPVA